MTLTRAPTAALSPRQHEVLQLVAQGLTNGEIAKRIFVAEGTVKWHLKQILLKTNSANRSEAVARLYGQADHDPALVPPR